MSKSLSPSPTEQVSCPCGTRLSAEIAFRTPTRNYQRCPACGLVFFSPRPSGSRITEFYRDSYEGTYRRFERGSIRAPVFRSALRHLSKYRRPPGRLLDIGCGSGEFLELCHARGWTCFGLELSREAGARTSRRGITMLPNAWLDQPSTFGDQSERYDVITLINVLEAMLNPADVLRRVSEALAPGGLVLIRVPNGAFHIPVRWPVWWMGAGHQQAFHLFVYTPESLEFHLRAAGLVPVSIRNSQTSHGPVSSSDSILRRLAWRVGGKGLWIVAQSAYWLTGGRVVWAASFEIIARPSTGQSEATSKQEDSR